jgi:hypothetical protein
MLNLVLIMSVMPLDELVNVTSEFFSVTCFLLSCDGQQLG